MCCKQIFHKLSMVTLVINGGDDGDLKFQPFKQEIERLLESHGIKSLHCFWKILVPVQRQHEKRARLTKIVFRLTNQNSSCPKVYIYCISMGSPFGVVNDCKEKRKKIVMSHEILPPARMFFLNLEFLYI